MDTAGLAVVGHKSLARRIKSKITGTSAVRIERQGGLYRGLTKAPLTRLTRILNRPRKRNLPDDVRVNLQVCEPSRYQPAYASWAEDKPEIPGMKRRGHASLYGSL